MNEGRRKKRNWKSLFIDRSSLIVAIDSVGLEGLDVELGVVSSS
jgi:hypothetical protein